MNIAFLQPEFEQKICGVTIGVDVGTSDIEGLSESFRELLNVVPVDGQGSIAGCDAVFRQCENQQAVEVLLPFRSDRLSQHRILISVAASPFPALESAALAVLAPPFAPGGVGVCH